MEIPYNRHNFVAVTNKLKQMKKLLSVIITLSASCFMGICQNYIEIDLTGKHIHTRSLTDAPEAYISKDILTVSFDGSGMYSLYIEDSFGVTVYSSALPANGMEYDYDLSGIGEGLFRLVISGPSGDYEGHFIIN